MVASALIARLTFVTTQAVTNGFVEQLETEEVPAMHTTAFAIAYTYPFERILEPKSEPFIHRTIPHAEK